METESNHSNSYMNSYNKSQTSTAKFEEFFKTVYDDLNGGML